MDWETVRDEADGALSTVILNRSQKHNAFGAKKHSIAHSSQGPAEMTGKISELGLKGAVAWMKQGD
jgi:hypothetical protein